MTNWRATPAVFFRLSKFDVNKWFDGQPHLVRRGADFPEEMADEDIIHRLRNAATYRKCSLVVTATPAGVIVQSNRTQKEGFDQGGLVDQLIAAGDQIEVLEKALMGMEEALSDLAQAYDHRLRALEADMQLLKEEPSKLKTR